MDGIASQVYKLHTFEELILYNFTLKDAFLHNGKVGDILWGPLSESSMPEAIASIASALLLTFGVYRLYI